MRPTRYIVFGDHFNGKAPLTDRYTIDDTLGTVAFRTAGYSAEGGALALLADASQGDNVQISTVDPLQCALSEESELEARFRLWSDDAVRARIGFWQDSSNWVGLEISTDLAGGGYALIGNRATTFYYDYHPDKIDPAWHRLSVRLLGSGAGAEAVIDGDEDNKLTLTNGEIPVSDRYGIFAYAETRGSSGVTAGEQRGLLLNYWQVKQRR